MFQDLVFGSRYDQLSEAKHVVFRSSLGAERYPICVDQVSAEISNADTGFRLANRFQACHSAMESSAQFNRRIQHLSEDCLHLVTE